MVFQEVPAECEEVFGENDGECLAFGWQTTPGLGLRRGRRASRWPVKPNSRRENQRDNWNSTQHSANMGGELPLGAYPSDAQMRKTELRVGSMISDHHGKQIGSFRFRLGCILALRECLRWSFAWIMIWAVAVVAARAVFRIDQSVLMWGFLGLAVALTAGVLWAARQLPKPNSIRALLDRHGCLGGLLMAAGDTNIGRWSECISNVPLPALRWRLGRQMTLLAMSVAFLAAAFLAPDRSLSFGRETALQIGGGMKKLTEKLQILKQERIIPPEKAEALEKNLERIRKEAQGNDPAKTMEAMDHLEISFSKEAAEAAESAVKQANSAGRMEKLAAAIQTAQSQMDPKQFSDAMKELAKMAEQAAAESEMLDEGLEGELGEACRQGTLSAEQLQALREALGECKDCQMGQIARLIDAQLIDAELLAECEGGGEFDEAELIEALLLCENGDELGDLLAALNCGCLPGRGGISRGRADAAMSWSNGTEKDGAAFKEKVLPPAAVASLKESKLVGVSLGNPTAKNPSGGSTGGALSSTQAGGGEAHSQTILPEHKKAVQRYFDRKKK